MTAEDKKVSLIVAMEANGGIGFQGGMPWKNVTELRHFRKATQDSVLIIGSRTAESLIALHPALKGQVFTPQEQQVLKGRQIIVVSSKEHVRDYVRLGLYVERSLEEAIAKAHELRGDAPGQIYLAGGGQLYKEALEKDLIDAMLISFLVDDYPCDTFFPEFTRSEWDVSLMRTDRTFTVELYTKRTDLNEPALYSS
jgi:dihydrofolate reductase